MSLRLRHPWGLVLLGTASFAITLTHIQLTRPQPIAMPLAVMPVGDLVAQAPPTTQPPALPVPNSASAPWTAAPPPMDLEALIAAAQSVVSEVRLEAIEALASAPRERAVPVLAKIAERGESDADRHAALSALHGLAVAQGDTDSAIRDLLRQLVYDGNDDGVSAYAAAALENLEERAWS